MERLGYVEEGASHQRCWVWRGARWEVVTRERMKDWVIM